MSRRKETTETTETTVVRKRRVEFTAAQLRERLRLPEDARFEATDGGGNVLTEAAGNLGIIATWTRTVTK